ncbi:hypothetical protein HY489_01880 [Candidatus Woesearchaeota archaeon]|nr:hypothetical protein [Candidatus Woesearchaeota archaeon]
MSDLYDKLCKYGNIELAFRRARKGKTRKPYVVDFERDLEKNLLRLQDELINHTYSPRPLETFVIKDPKTRKISRSDFRDRVVHHALCNMIEPIFDKTFICDSFANRTGKGTLKAIERFEYFARKVSLNWSRASFVLKADVRKYFDNVDHEILLRILKRMINDERSEWLCHIIIKNFSTSPGKGMPLGNLTSQFFANVYLNELDKFVKHVLKVKHYVRYVDDFVVLSPSAKNLHGIKSRIDDFLRTALCLELHPQKSIIKNMQGGVDFLGMRVFPKHRLLRKKNIRRFKRKLKVLNDEYQQSQISEDKACEFLQGWCTYAMNACTWKWRMKVLDDFERSRRTISRKEFEAYYKLSQ